MCDSKFEIKMFNVEWGLFAHTAPLFNEVFKVHIFPRLARYSGFQVLKLETFYDVRYCRIYRAYFSQYWQVPLETFVMQIMNNRT